MLFSHTVYVFSSSSGITSVFQFVVMVCFCLVVTVIKNALNIFWFSLQCDSLYLNLNFSDLDLI